MSNTHSWVDYHKYMATHSEVEAWALIEMIQRHEGVQPRQLLEVEDHWNLIMNYLPLLRQQPVVIA
jgi:hypothetical protein